MPASRSRLTHHASIEVIRPTRGCLHARRRDSPAWSAASRYVAHMEHDIFGSVRTSKWSDPSSGIVHVAQATREEGVGSGECGENLGRGPARTSCDRIRRRQTTGSRTWVTGRGPSRPPGANRRRPSPASWSSEVLPSVGADRDRPHEVGEMLVFLLRPKLDCVGDHGDEAVERAAGHPRRMRTVIRDPRTGRCPPMWRIIEIGRDVVVVPLRCPRRRSPHRGWHH